MTDVIQKLLYERQKIDEQIAELTLPPLPWVVDFVDDYTCVLDADGEEVMSNESHYPAEVKPVAQEFIVECVNNYHKMKKVFDILSLACVDGGVYLTESQKAELHNIITNPLINHCPR